MANYSGLKQNKPFPADYVLGLETLKSALDYNDYEDSGSISIDMSKIPTGTGFRVDFYKSTKRLVLTVIDDEGKFEEINLPFINDYLSLDFSFWGEPGMFLLAPASSNQNNWCFAEKFYDDGSGYDFGALPLYSNDFCVCTDNIITDTENDRFSGFVTKLNDFTVVLSQHVAV